MTSGTALPPNLYKPRRSKENKFKWYLILAISIVFIVLAVTVIALTIYLTSDNETVGDKQAQTNNGGKETKTSTTIQQRSTTTETTYSSTKQQPTAYSTTKQEQPSTTSTVATITVESTPKVMTLVPQVTTTIVSTPRPTSAIATTDKLPSSSDTHTTQQAVPSSQSTTNKVVSSSQSTTNKVVASSETTTQPVVSSSDSTTEMSSSKQESTTTLSTTSRSSTTSFTEKVTTQSPTISSSESTTKIFSTTSTTKNPSTLTDAPRSTTKLSSTSATSTTIQSTAPTTKEASVSMIKLTSSAISTSSPFLLTCEVANVPGWIDLQIYRHFGNNQSGLVAQMTAGAIVPTVIVIDDALTFSANHHTDAITMVLLAQTFDCNHAGIYSCSVSSANIVLEDKTEVKVSEAPPEILLPLGIIEGRTMALDCIVEFQGTSGDIKWTFSPPGMSNTFYDLSIIPETKNSTTACTTQLESKLTFTPGMYDNGSNFRCEVVNAQGYNGTTVLQETIPFYVIENSFCLNRDFTIHNHPYQPCGKIVYCSDIGPIVYEINCPNPGYCYDAVSTQCVLAENLNI